MRREVWAVSLLAVVLPAGALSGRGFGAAPPKKAKKAKTATKEDGSTVGVWDECLAWASKNGASVKGILFEEAAGKGGTNVVAARAFSMDEDILTVPSALAVGLGDPEKQEGDDIVDSGANFCEWYSETKTPFFAPYLKTFPKEPSSPTPDFWSAEELAELEWSGLSDRASERRARVASVAAARKVGEDALRRATWIASTRSIPMRLGAEASLSEEAPEGADSADSAQLGNEIRVLVPLFDCLNWGAAPNAELKILDADKDDSTFALVAKRRIEAGESLTISYPRCASSVELLFNYGFVPNAHVDGSSNADARLEGVDAFSWSTTAAADRETLLLKEAAGPASLATREAVKLRLALKSTLDHKNHRAFFKATRAMNAGIALGGKAPMPVPPGQERNRVSKGRGKGGGSYGM